MSESKGEDMQWLTKQEQYSQTKNEKKVSSIENGGRIEYHQQYQTILNLYHSGIPIYIMKNILTVENEKDDGDRSSVANWK